MCSTPRIPDDELEYKFMDLAQTTLSSSNAHDVL